MPIYIGTSGWIYSDWRKKFYPEDLKKQKELEFYSQHFNTVELNASFYRLPQEKTFLNWYLRTPENFIFSVKVSRFITHIKRLKNVQEPWLLFLKRVSNLKEKLGPLLLQFPSSFQQTDENLSRIDKFLKRNNNLELKLAFEFRHRSWFSEETFSLLKNYNRAWVISDSLSWPKEEKVTSDFIYIRFHGPESLFSSKYSFREMEKWSRKIKRWQREAKDIYVYFNNDFNCYAVFNALELRSLLEK